MLTRIRNANIVKARNVSVIRTNLNVNIAKILEKEGFIESFEECGEFFLKKKGLTYKYILITLKYKGIKQEPYINGLKHISRPGLRVYASYDKIPKILGGIGVVVCFYLTFLKILVTFKV